MGRKIGFSYIGAAIFIFALWLLGSASSVNAAGLADYTAQAATSTPVAPPNTPTPAPPANTPTPAATVAPSPTSGGGGSGQVFVSCRYYGPYDREFIIQLEQGHGGAPTVNITLELVTGGQQRDQFTAYTYSYRGPYLSLNADARWPDQATGYASATCGYAIPTDTPLPTNTPNYALTPSPTNTPTATIPPREPGPPPPATEVPPSTPSGPLPTETATPPASLTTATATPAPVNSETPTLAVPLESPPPQPPTPYPDAPPPTFTPLATSDTGAGGGAIPGLPRTGSSGVGDWLGLGLAVLGIIAVGILLRRASRSDTAVQLDSCN